MAVMLHMQLRGFSGVVVGMFMVATRGVRMVRRFFMIATLMMLCRFPMVPSSVLMMLSGFMMVFCGFLRHLLCPSFDFFRAVCGT